MDCSTRNQSTEIEVKNLDHLGLVAGIIDEIGIVEIINEQATEHLLGEGIEPKQLNDDKIGRVMDKLYQLNVS
ncbi:MAG: DUF4277 domain-containing protein, partial [Microcystis aeruginosa Ma_MB_F_20061100_S19D]